MISVERISESPTAVQIDRNSSIEGPRLPFERESVRVIIYRKRGKKKEVLFLEKDKDSTTTPHRQELPGGSIEFEPPATFEQILYEGIREVFDETKIILGELNLEDRTVANPLPYTYLGYKDYNRKKRGTKKSRTRVHALQFELDEVQSRQPIVLESKPLGNHKKAEWTSMPKLRKKKKNRRIAANSSMFIEHILSEAA